MSSFEIYAIITWLEGSDELYRLPTLGMADATALTSILEMLFLKLVDSSEQIPNRLFYSNCDNCQN